MNLEENTLALAGILQAVDLVHQAAYRNMIDATLYQASIGSVLKIDARDTIDVYGGLSGLRLGLSMLATGKYQKYSPKQRETLYYAFTLIRIEGLLRKNPQMLTELSAGIQEAITHSELHSPTHPEVIAKLAEVYLKTLSTLSLRIYVKGEPRYLQDSENVQRIRALLLASIRSVYLWRQKGGTIWQTVRHLSTIKRIAQYWLEVEKSTPNSVSESPRSER